MSTDASRLFCNPNCIGEKIILKKIFSKKGRATIDGISFFQNIKKTFPNEIAIRI
jgi:hypothetical protein